MKTTNGPCCRGFAASREAGAALVDAKDTAARYPWVERKGLRGALFAPDDACVTPQDAMNRMADSLLRTGLVDFHFGQSVSSIDGDEAIARGKSIRFDFAFVCIGDDAGALLPQAFAGEPMERFVVQMMRTRPTERLGVIAASGACAARQPGFASCPSAALVRSRLLVDKPHLAENGLAFIASQQEDGRVTVGATATPAESGPGFRREDLDEMILSEARRTIGVALKIEERWEGSFSRHADKPFCTDVVYPNVTIVGGLGNNGLTLSLGLAEEIVSRTLG